MLRILYLKWGKLLHFDFILFCPVRDGIWVEKNMYLIAKVPLGTKYMSCLRHLIKLGDYHFYQYSVPMALTLKMQIYSTRTVARRFQYRINCSGNNRNVFRCKGVIPTCRITSRWAFVG